MPPTDSLVERFGLFTIIVLGEVVFGVVDGLSSAERDVKTITTGMIALVIGFGFWWIYFDLVGRRLPRNDGRALANWLLSHLPITLSIAAAGAAMVSLIGHAHDARTPAGTAWLLAGAVALGLLALIVTERALVDAERLAVVYRPLSLAMAAAERPRPSSSAGLDRRRGSSRCCSWRSCRCSGSSPSAASCAPTPGATNARPPPAALPPDHTIRRSPQTRVRRPAPVSRRRRPNHTSVPSMGGSPGVPGDGRIPYERRCRGRARHRV